jgi:hypothetical protein
MARMMVRMATKPQLKDNAIAINSTCAYLNGEWEAIKTSGIIVN